MHVETYAAVPCGDRESLVVVDGRLPSIVGEPLRAAGAAVRLRTAASGCELPRDTRRARARRSLVVRRGAAPPARARG